MTSIFSAGMDADSTYSIAIACIIIPKTSRPTKLIVLTSHVLNKCFDFVSKTFNWYYWLVLFEQKLQMDKSHTA